LVDFDPAHYGANNLSLAVTIEIVEPLHDLFGEIFPCGLMMSERSRSRPAASSAACRRLATLETASPCRGIARLDRQSAIASRRIERLIDSYAEGVIENPNSPLDRPGLKQAIVRNSKERRQAAEDAAGLERESFTHHQPHGRFRRKGREGARQIRRL